MGPWFHGLLPLTLTLGGALGALLLEVTAGERGRRATTLWNALVLVSALVADLHLLAFPPGELFSGALVLDGLSLGVGAVALFAGLCAVLFAEDYLRRERAVTGEFGALLLFSVSGAWLLAASGDLLMALVALELLSLPAYALIGYLRNRARSVEAALKYFVPGAVATALLAYGAAWVYGATGTLFYAGIAKAVGQGHASPALLAAGAALVLSALAFKVGMVPFHAWVPDVYEGAPAPVAGFLAAAAKAAALAALLRFFRDPLPVWGNWGTLCALLAVAAMTLGNLAAFVQGTVKRMLAYSSVSQVGYLLVGLATLGVAPDADVTRAVVFYLIAYACMVLGAFGWLSRVAGGGEKVRLFEAFEGYGRKRPVEAALMALALFSLAGLPPTSGFFGKVLLFRLAVNHGYVWLALLGVLFSLLAFAYYLRLVVVMYMRPASGAAEWAEGEESASFAHRVGMGLCALGTIAAIFIPLSF